MKRMIVRALPAPLRDRLKDAQIVVRLRNAERAVSRPLPKKRKPHGLPGELIVSLTSHPPRFGTLAKTVRGLLAQSVKADHTVVWLTEEHAKLLPPDVLALRDEGLTIGICEDMRSYAKIIPALERWPEGYIVTADDDLYYEPKWLETLVNGVVPGEKVIVTRRVMRPHGKPGNYTPYQEWDWDFLTDEDVRDDLFPTGVGGVLYPPGSLAPEVLDRTAFRKLAPTEDDMWLFWMGRRAGSKARQVGGGFAQVTWDGTQETSLISQNSDGRNDPQLAAIMAAYPES